MNKFQIENSFNLFTPRWRLRFSKVLCCGALEILSITTIRHDLNWGDYLQCCQALWRNNGLRKMDASFLVSVIVAPLFKSCIRVASFANNSLKLYEVLKVVCTEANSIVYQISINGDWYFNIYCQNYHITLFYTKKKLYESFTVN